MLSDKIKNLVILVMLTFFSIVSFSYAGPFQDVKPEHWSYKETKALFEENNLTHVKFQKNDIMSRYEVALAVSELFKIYGVNTTNLSLRELGFEYSDELALLKVKLPYVEEEMKKLRKEYEKVMREMLKNKEISPIRVNGVEINPIWNNSYKTSEIKIKD